MDKDGGVVHEEGEDEEDKNGGDEDHEGKDEGAEDHGEGDEDKGEGDEDKKDGGAVHEEGEEDHEGDEDKVEGDEDHGGAVYGSTAPTFGYDVQIRLLLSDLRQPKPGPDLQNPRSASRAHDIEGAPQEPPRRLESDAEEVRKRAARRLASAVLGTPGFSGPTKAQPATNNDRQPPTNNDRQTLGATLTSEYAPRTSDAAQQRREGLGTYDELNAVGSPVTRPPPVDLAPPVPSNSRSKLQRWRRAFGYGTPTLLPETVPDNSRNPSPVGRRQQPKNVDSTTCVNGIGIIGETFGFGHARRTSESGVVPKDVVNVKERSERPGRNVSGAQRQRGATGSTAGRHRIDRWGGLFV